MTEVSINEQALQRLQEEVNRMRKFRPVFWTVLILCLGWTMSDALTSRFHSTTIGFGLFYVVFLSVVNQNYQFRKALVDVFTPPRG